MPPDTHNFNLPPEDRPDIPGLRAREKEAASNPNGNTAVQSGDPSSSDGSAQTGQHGDSRDSLAPSALSGAESTAAAGAALTEGGAMAATSRLGAVKNLFWGTSARRKRTVGGGVAGLIIGGGLLGISVLSGPGQLVQLSMILQRNFAGTNIASANRINKLFRFAPGARDIGETRMGALGRQFLRPALDRLSNMGIEFDTNSTGGIKTANIDTQRLAGNYPELKNMSAQERQSWIADKFNLTPDQISIDGSHSFSIDAANFPIDSASALQTSSLKLLGDGHILTGINTRVLSKYYDTPSLWHPIQKAKSALRQKLTTVAEQKAAEKDRVTTEIADPVENTVAPTRDSLKGKLSDSSVSSALNRALITTAVLCTVRSAADDVVKFNHDAIVVPAELQAADKIAVGEQVRSNDDISLEQAGGVASSFTDNNGKTIWQGKALQAEAGMNPTGPDLSTNYSQAFSNKTTADNIKKAVQISGPFGIDVTSVACSTPGLIVQGLGNILLFVINIPDGETGSFAVYAGEQAATTVAVGGATYFLEHEFINLIKDNAVVPAILSGPVGGNLLAYGARAASVTAGAAEGEIPLANSVATQFALQDQQQRDRQFRSESFFARTFDIYDYRSLVGHLAESFSTSPGQNFATAIGGFQNLVPNLLSSLSSIFLPHTHAATATYNWGFPTYGIPTNILNSPDTVNPYANAETVAKTLDSSCLNSDGSVNSSCDLISRAHDCFGVDITKDSNAWNVIPKTPVNPADDSYVNAHCDDTSDGTWRRMILFVFDTRTMQATACQQGDDQSCQDTGYGQSTSSSSSSSAPTSSSGYKNPLRDVKGLFPRRIDQGVDYGGHGPIYAIGNGKVDQAYPYGGSSGWPGPSCPSGGCGGWISYTLSDGPAAGKIVYFAESCQPTLKSGDPVTPDTVICQMNGDSDPWIETGWGAASAGSQPLAQLYGGNGCCTTTVGVNFNDLLKSLGAPSGQVTNPPIGRPLPADWPKWK